MAKALTLKKSTHPRGTITGSRGGRGRRETLNGKTVHSELAPAWEALEAYIKKSTASKTAAAKSLQEAGILDSTGRLHSRYRG